MSAADSGSRYLGPIAGRVTRHALIVGGAALLISLGLVLVDSGLTWERFLRAWLTGFLFVLSISLGGLFFVFVHHLARAGWSVVVRRIAEAVAANLVWVWILFLPILLLMLFGHGDVLYHWADPLVTDPQSDHYDAVLAGKSGYLNPTFWLIRAVVFLGIWAVISRFFFRNSVAQDASGAIRLTHLMQRWAPAAALLYAFSQSYAAIDWVMTLDAHWFSTMYPVYFFAASTCGFFGAAVLAVYVVQRAGKLSEVTLEHYQDLGKLLFAFGVVFWAYIAFSQYMLIWYANIPEETTWYLARTIGGWASVSWLLLIGHFAVPFLLLVTRHTKRVKPIIAVIALWMVLLHYVDLYWLVMPELPASAIRAAGGLPALQAAVESGAVDIGFHPHLVDLTCLVGMAALLVAGTAWRLREVALLPVHDPRLGESLAFENM